MLQHFGTVVQEKCGWSDIILITPTSKYPPFPKGSILNDIMCLGEQFVNFSIFAQNFKNQARRMFFLKLFDDNYLHQNQYGLCIPD